MAADTVGASWRYFALVSFLNDLALRGMGKIQDPATGRMMPDLNLARTAIDWLEMLEEKTAGNLTEDESRLLRQVLTTLRLNYVDEREREGSKPPEGGGESGGETGGEAGEAGVTPPGS